MGPDFLLCVGLLRLLDHCICIAMAMGFAKSISKALGLTMKGPEQLTHQGGLTIRGAN